MGVIGVMLERGIYSWTGNIFDAPATANKNIYQRIISGSARYRSRAIADSWKHARDIDFE